MQHQNQRRELVKRVPGRTAPAQTLRWWGWSRGWVARGCSGRRGRTRRLCSVLTRVLCWIQYGVRNGKRMLETVNENLPDLTVSEELSRRRTVSVRRVPRKTTLTRRPRRSIWSTTIEVEKSDDDTGEIEWNQTSFACGLVVRYVGANCPLIREQTNLGNPWGAVRTSHPVFHGTLRPWTCRCRRSSPPRTRNWSLRGECIQKVGRMSCTIHDVNINKWMLVHHTYYDACEYQSCYICKTYCEGETDQKWWWYCFRSNDPNEFEDQKYKWYVLWILWICTINKGTDWYDDAKAELSAWLSL